ncbi:hypothetical protein GKQ77_01830 [Streptomyces sp. BG9H]|uniref:Uncharacterized protein n=1 Tax=Streptomyces anatolicus TaxID=2675858 RepID=A0ABS6YIA8_9ACTN|nr:hypothetical protein [Streptomyces anatolicus]MBW5420311.1 hypothetical protein [Streptomyces anatolicus]
MIDALGTFLAMLGLWLAAGAALATLLVLSTAAALTWAWNTARRRPTRPSWAHGRRAARIYARTRVTAPTGHTAPCRQEPS